jgi:hypothetical protein
MQLIKVLFLDDDTERWETFSEIVGSHSFIDLVWVKTSSKAIKALDNTYWDIICLDHDLGGKSFVDSFEKNTGYTVAKKIGTDSKYNEDLIFIHSWNPIGADNISNILSKSIKLPFNNDFAHIIVDHARLLLSKKVDET